tara:strand:+ start:4670 stop:5347 length:678 start_codon:yes stop_codon:yes gene_type:complete
MIRKTAIYLLIVSHIFVVSCSSSAPKPSTTVKRAIETREYSVDFDTLMRASIGVLQDLGYTIDVLNDSYGLITASKQTTNEKGRSSGDNDKVSAGDVILGALAVITLVAMFKNSDDDDDDGGDCFFCGGGGSSEDEGPNVYILKTTMNVTQDSEDPISSSIRVNFEASMERGGKIRYAGTQYSSEFFQSFFGALDKSLFLDENLGPEEAVIDEEEAPNDVSLIAN